jgi:hypothetical protein
MFPDRPPALADQAIKQDFLLRRALNVEAEQFR